MNTSPDSILPGTIKWTLVTLAYLAADVSVNRHLDIWCRDARD